MVPDRFATQLPAESEVLHDYDSRMLVRMPEGTQGAIDQRYASLLEDTRYLNYRAWRGRAGGNDPADLPDLRDAYFVIALIGPQDSKWRSQIESHGLTIVDHVNPYGLLVRGSSAAVQSAASSLQTSRDYPVITHALPLPESSRYGADVAEWLKSRSNPEDLGFRVDDGQGLVRVVFHEDIDFSQGHSLVSDYVEAGPEFVSGGPSGQYRASAATLSTLLEQVPEVAYVHGVYPKELHNNIGPLEHITNIEPVWTDLGYIGTGLIAGINDSGVDESHPDFPAGTILATQGAMSGTDNGHGTHVSGTVAGRGAAPSPTNTSSCGDISTPLPDARGMAHGAQIVHNNLFDGGIGDEAAMMQWQSQQGAVINNNSWGYGGLFGPVTTYDAETVAVDAAVREADPGVDSQMAIVFSAGNSGASGVSKPANGKNVITVGASQNDRCGSYIPSQCAGPDIDGMACFSSQGPSQGRNKPDIVAPGTDVLSTGSSDPEASWGGWDQPWTGPEYAIVPGTSMSAPMVTGAATVFMEAYQDLNGDLPSPALVKAALINTATDMDGSGFPSNIQGWGRLNLRKAIEGPVEDGIKFFDQDEVDHLSTGESWSTEIGVASADEPVRFSLVWTDPPGAAGCDPCHINDLDLIVTAPDGTVYRGNQFSGAWSETDASGRDDGNNVENVYVEAPVSGNWQVEIDGFNVAVNPGDLTGQDFALVATGDFGGITVDPDTVDACTADGSTDFTVTLTNQFEGTTDLAASGLPSGTSGSFDPNPVVFPDVTSIYTLSDLGLAAGGAYQFEITATDDTDTEITASATVDLTLYEAIADQIVLLTPADQVTNVDLRPEFTWGAADAAEYQLQVATDAGFTSIVHDVVVEGTSFIPDADLATGTDFFWRVRGDNACGVGTWSNVFEFQTRFEPIIDIAPESMAFELAPDASDNDILSISNTGTGDLLWEIDTDSLEGAGLGLQAHDPALDEAFDLPDFTVEGSTSPVSVEFTVDGGVLTRGDVTGFSFIGTASGVSGISSWASDTCMVLEAPDGTTFGVGGLSGSDAECDVNDWDFQGSGSSDDGTYESSHDDVFDPPVPDEGEWTIRFLNDWASGSAGDITWSDVTVTLHKQPLPVCIEGEMTTVPWLSTSSASGTTASGTSDDVTVTVDSTGLTHGEYEGFLCIGSNSADGQTMIPVPVVANVVDPTVGVLEGTVTTAGYCQADPGPVEGALVSITPSPAITDVTPNVINGTGIANSEFSVERANGIEVGLRGKLRFNDNCSAENTFNSNGDGTYSFDAGVAQDSGGSDCASPETAVWSFDWAVNTDFDGSTGDVLEDYVYEMGFDGDPGTGTDFLVFDPVTPTTEVPFFDHAIGDNTTAAGGGTVAADGPTYESLIAANNVAQNSWRYDFFNDPGTALENFDPTVDGRYTVYLTVRDPGTNEVVAHSEIDILVGNEPAAPPAPYQAITDENGFYSIEISEDENPLSVNVSSEGYLDATATGVNIVSGGVVVEDFDLLTDSACAEITPASFDFEVILGDTDSDLLNISNANGNIDLDWSVDSFEPAGNSGSPNDRAVTVLEEDFEGTFPPADWTTIDNTGECPWLSSDDYDLSGWDGSPARGAAADSDTCGSGTTADAEMISPSLDLTGLSNLELRFDMALRTLGGTELHVDVSTDGGGSWTNLETWTSNFAYPDDDWLPVEIDLSAYEGEPDVQLRWNYIAPGWHWWTFVDNVVVAEAPPSCENLNNVPWLTLTPTAGTAIPGTSDDVTVGVDTTGLVDGVYESTICVNTSDPSVALTEIPVSMTVNDPELATFTGTVTGQVCGEAPEPLDGATISIDGMTNVVTTETDENGDYFVKVHEDESPADVTVSADGYVSQTTAGVSFVGLDVIEQDYNLAFDSACLDIDPDSLSATLGLDSTVDLPVDIGNLGSATLNWDIVAEAMSMADIRAARDPDNAARLRQTDEPLIGFNFTTSASSTADPQNWNRVSDGEGLLEDVQDDTGAATSVDIEWGGLTSDGLIFLSSDNVAGDAVPQFDYDLSGMSGYGFRSDGHFFIELSGLDPNADYEYWFVGYRSTSSIDNLVGVSDGDDINAFEFNQFIDSGDNDGRFVINDLVSEDTQDFNDLSFVARSSSTGTLRFEWEGDTQTTVIGALAIRQATDCNIPDWLSLAPMTGSVDSGALPDTVTATLDPTGLAPDVYEGNFCVESNDPVTPLVEVPVTMTTELPPDWGAITGNVASLGHCQANEVSLEGATVEVVGSLDTYTVETDENGFYEIYLPEGESPLTITASADNHLSDSTTVNFAGGDAVTADIDLLLEEPCASVQPEGLSIDLDADEQTTGLIELSNALGHATLNWQIDTALPTNLQAEPSGEAPRSAVGASENAVSLNELLDIEPRSVSVTQPFEKVIDCDSASGLIINEDGSVENGYSGNLATVSEVEFVDYYEPLEHPANLQSLCVSMVRLAGGPTSRDVELVVYADDGPGGTPGTLIGSMSATVDNIPEWPISTPVWASFDITPMGVSIASGGVYVGVGYEPADPNVFIAADESTDNPVAHAGGYWWNDSAGDWIPIQDSWEEYRALFVRVQQGVIDCSNPVGVPWLSVDPSFGIVNAGQTREIDVTLDATGLAPGTYEAGLCIFSNDPVNDVLSVPVNLNVRVPTDWATIEGTVETTGYCDENPGALEGATIEVAGVNDIYTTQTDATGAYQISLPANESPVEVTASHASHLDASEPGVALTAGETEMVDLVLQLAEPCASATPDQFDSILEPGGTTQFTMALSNAGAAPFNWSAATEEAGGAGHEPNTAREAGDNVRMALPKMILRDVLLEETFADAVMPPPDWTVESTNTNFTWELNDFSPQTGTHYGSVLFDAALVPQDEWLITPELNVSEGTLSLWSLGSIFWCRDDNDNCDLNVWIIPGEVGDGDEILLGQVDDDWPDNFVWAQSTFDLTPHVDGSPIRIGFQYEGVDGAEVSIDNIQVAGTAAPAGCVDPQGAPWISLETGSGVVGADSTQEVAVTLDATSLVDETVEGNVCVTTSDQNNSLIIVPVTLGVLAAPVIDVNPTSLTAVLEDGGTDLQSFNVANSGEATLDWSIDDTTAGCELPGWASVDPVSGSVDSGNGEDVDVTFDATGLEAGVYDATVCVDNNDPANPVVEVDLQLTVDETLSTVQGTVMSLGYCSDNPSAAAGAGILIEGISGTYSGSADGSGFYQIDVPADETPVNVSASQGGHITGMVSDVDLVAGEASTVDIDLVLEAPCADIAPSALSFAMAEGEATESLSIDNSGGAASLNWTLDSGTGCYDAGVDTWLTLSSSGDTVGAGSSQAVDVTANATGMEAGQHTAQLCISTDDGEADQFSIPVELNVQGEVILHDRFEMDG